MTEKFDSPIMAALEKFEAAEANLLKLERITAELEELRPEGVVFGTVPEYEDRARSFSLCCRATQDRWMETNCATIGHKRNSARSAGCS